MASLTMMASLSAAVAVDRRVQQQQAAATPRRGLVVARATKVDGQEPSAKLAVESSTDGRRAVVFAAAAAAVSAFGRVAFAESDVKKGSPEAKKKYATVCVTMPTAKVCHN
ncbi:photosystem II 5 kDa protein, chloroplastic [Lolium perenne]|uniref:photosystem II 5 kDa protein, chloroplastic n=1 Tax=Lolium perenne TaxID=4522 RepID=UPI0021EB5335|nr:photosystem II 5 kDa protein, chloroplastic-like [Lolium perenne]